VNFTTLSIKESRAWTRDAHLLGRGPQRAILACFGQFESRKDFMAALDEALEDTEHWVYDRRTIRWHDDWGLYKFGPLPSFAPFIIRLENLEEDLCFKERKKK
jgi:hypothetical protein